MHAAHHGAGRGQPHHHRPVRLRGETKWRRARAHGAASRQHGRGYPREDRRALHRGGWRRKIAFHHPGIATARRTLFAFSSMKHPRCLLAALGLITGALLPLSAAEPARPVAPRFSAGNMDPTVDPRADFAHYAWGNWQKNNPVPADKSRWGAFNELDQFNQAGLKGILETAAARSHEPGSVEQKVGDFFTSAMNTTAIDAAGLKPAAPELAQVAAIGSTADLARTLAALHNHGVTGFFRVFVDADEKNSKMNALQANQGGLSLPSKDYYFGEQFEKQRAAFLEHVTKMFTLAGDTPEAAAAGAKTVFEVEKSLATNAL